MEEHSFEFVDAPAFEITKAYRDDNGQMFVEGIASTVEIDQTGERMSPEAIAKMAVRAIGLPLRDEHGHGWHDRLGEIVKAEVVNDEENRPALWIKARLFDWSTKAKDLFKFLQTGTKMGLSVAGKVRSGGLVKQLAENIGKYVPTYKDVELTEISITDHPANLGTFAVAVAKSMTSQTVNQQASMQVAKDVADSHSEKPEEYKDVATGDFLDSENFKYPADDQHLMPALRYFNQEGQRTAGGYEPEKWSQMGHKLARKLATKTGDTYRYDSESESVTKPSESQTAKEVSEMTDHGNLVSKQVNDQTRDFLKHWGKDIDDAGVVSKAKPNETNDVEKAKVAPKGQTPASDISSSSNSAGGPTGATDKAASQTSPAVGAPSTDTTTSPMDTPTAPTKKSNTSTIESLLADIATSLSTAASSLSGSSSSSSSDSSSSSSDSDFSSDSSTSTDSSTGTSSTSTDKALDDDELLNSLAALNKAAEGFKDAVAKKRGAKPAGGGESSSYTSSANTSAPTATQKSIDEETRNEIRELKELVLDLKKSQDAQPVARKGYAIAVEKKFQGYNDTQGEYSPDVLDELMNDTRATTADVHKYKGFNTLPKWYKPAA